MSVDVLKSCTRLDGWTVGRDFCPLRISKPRFKIPLFQMGVVGEKRNDGQVSRDTCPSALLLPDITFIVLITVAACGILPLPLALCGSEIRTS